jgi:ParB-like chromosome segregation protein Spo0J
MTIRTDKIKITARVRKEIGKIEELAANIREHGLINPITVMGDRNIYCPSERSRVRHV